MGVTKFSALRAWFYRKIYQFVIVVYSVQLRAHVFQLNFSVFCWNSDRTIVVATLSFTHSFIFWSHVWCTKWMWFSNYLNSCKSWRHSYIEIRDRDRVQSATYQLYESFFGVYYTNMCSFVVKIFLSLSTKWILKQIWSFCLRWTLRLN